MSMNWSSADFHRGARAVPAAVVAAGLGAGAGADALYDLGISYSTGTDGVAVDLVEAHKWFNLAAVSGLAAAAAARADVAVDMTARQIAEAQRQARAWLAAGNGRRAS